MQVKELEILIQQHIPDCQVKVQSEDNHHFEAVVISDNFENKKLLERQRLVLQVVNPYLLDGSLHAFSFKTYTVAQWSNKKNLEDR